MNKIYAIIGEAGSGKDRLASTLVEERPDLFHGLISYTTRPPREGEVNGKDYFFISLSEFQDKVKNGDILEYTQFRGWWYGTATDQLVKDKINIGVFNPTGVYSLSLKEMDLRTYRLQVSARERLIRQLTREQDPDVDEIVRRYQTDRADFQNLPFIYHYLDNKSLEDLEKSKRIIITDAEYDLGQF